MSRDDYLLACCRYIELNPVRVRMVAAPQDYPWSSCRYRLGVETADWFDLDPCYLAPWYGRRRRGGEPADCNDLLLETLLRTARLPFSRSR